MFKDLLKITKRKQFEYKINIIHDYEEVEYIENKVIEEKAKVSIEKNSLKVATSTKVEFKVEEPKYVQMKRDVSVLDDSIKKEEMYKNRLFETYNKSACSTQEQEEFVYEMNEV